MTMDAGTVHSVLCTYARKRLAQKENRLTPEQWVTLLNSFVHLRAVGECAALTGMMDRDVETEYFRMSMALVQESLKQKRRS
ncbi:MAG: hypothetical protein IKS37_05270 [Solobacterium sp.]|nr:hypothetical protein [Solobacterium sp.]